MQDIEHDKIKLEMQGMKASQESSFFMLELVLKEIKKEVSETLLNTQKTNGRVTKLEADYALIRMIREHKWLAIVLATGFLKIYELVDVHWLLNKLIALL